MIRNKWLSIFAGVLAVAAACFLGIALYIFINQGSGSENGEAGNQADANENITAQEAAAGADVTAAGENDAWAGADTETEVIADGEKATDEASVPGEDVPAIPILQVENVHEEGDNGGCTMDYSRVSLGNGTEAVFPELAGSLAAYSDEQIAGVREMYDFLLPVAGETDRWLSVYMGLSLTRADERMLSMHYDYSEYTGGAHGYYWDGGATFDTETGARLALGDICTDMGELARIVASILYAEDASRFSISEAEMAQNIAANEVSPDNVDSWFCTPEGLHIFFPPYSISYYAAGEPDVVVRYVDYPHIFNESYVAATDAYVTYDPPQSTFSRFDYDNDGTMNSVRIFSKHLQGEGLAATHQNFTIYLDEAEALEQQTAEYRAAYTYRIKSDGRSFFVVETENVDGTDTTYVYDISSGTAVLTGSVNGGVYVGTVNETGQSVVLQSSEPDGILFGGEAVIRWKVSAKGMLTEW